MADRYWVGETENWNGTAGTKWALTSGGAGGQAIPTSADDVFFDGASSFVTCTISTGNTGAKSINCTGFPGTLQGTASISVAGSITLVAGMTYNYFGTITITATASVTSAGKTFGGGFGVNGTGITVTLADALTTGIFNTTTLTAGTLDLAGFTLGTGTFSSSNSNTRAIAFGSGNIALISTAAGDTVLSMATAFGFTYTGTGGFTRNQAATALIVFGTTDGSTSNAPNLTVNAGASTLTIAASSFFKDVDFTGSTCTVSGSVRMAGNLILGSGTYTSFNPTFRATAIIGCGGKTLGNTIINGAGITVTLADDLTTGTTNTTTLTEGTLDLAGETLSTGIFSSSNSNTRAINFDGAILLTSTASTTVLNMAVATNFSYTGTGRFFRDQAATAMVAFGTTDGSTTNAPNLTVNAGASTLTISNNSFFKDVDFTGSTCTVSGSVNMAGDLTLASGGTYTSFNPTFRVSTAFLSIGKTLGGFGVNGTGITVTLADALTTGTTNTTTLTEGTLDLASLSGGYTLSTGIFSSNNSNTRAIIFGSGNIALTSTTASATVLQISTATNFTYTGTGGFTRNQAANATMTFGTTGGTTSNAPNLTVNAGSFDLTISFNSFFKDVDFTGSTCFVSGSLNINMAGDLTLASGGTYTFFNPTFRVSTTFSSIGKTLGGFGVNGTGITVTLADALTVGGFGPAGTIRLTQGTFSMGSFSVTTELFSSSNSNLRSLNLTSTTLTIKGSGGSAWNTATTTGLTLNPSTSTISMTSSFAKTFRGGDLLYNKLNQGGTGILTITGSNTFNDITNSVQPSTVRFTAGTTQTVSNFSLSGTNSSSRITINSTTPGSQFNLSKPSGTVNSQFLSIQDSNGTGGASWYATNSTNTGNNTGWIFNNTNGMFEFLV